MTTVLGLDPGTDKSSLVSFDGERIDLAVELPNDEMRDYLKHYLSSAGRILVIEKIQSFGMTVGESVFTTVFWSGRFAEAWDGRFDRLSRMAVKHHLCHTAKAKDANIRQALIDRFGGDNAIGKKATPGPMYGITSHKIAALAVAVTWFDLHRHDGDQVRPHVTAEF